MSAGMLSLFQEDFARAVRGGAVAPRVSALAAQPGFAVYRNTVLKGCVDALLANHPAVTRLVGEEWMRAAAALHARAHPPRDPRLVRYGAAFADFLAAFEPARQLPYLPGVARLDYCWCEAHLACDEPPLSGAAIAALPRDALARSVLRPHAAARWAWFENDPVATIWSANRASGEDAADLSDIPWRGDGVLITRPAEAVRHVPVDRAACSFLDACRAGQTVEQAVLAGLAADPGVDFTRLMALLVEAGVFADLVTEPEEEDA